MILARVQHHPSRAALIPALLEALSPLPVEVCSHSSDPANPWEGYKQCLSAIPECSHLLIVQDDALPCPNFAPAVEQVAERNPDTPVCLFLGAAPASTAARALRAMKQGQRYTPLLASTFVPLVAVLWPRHRAQEFLEWSHTARTTRADDGNAAAWVRKTRQQILICVPSLVEHNDYVPSVKGGRPYRFGAESWRHAVLLAEDGLEYDWLSA